ncbi:ATP-binding cassette domain-containing protein [Georgenia subflava]|uniref:ATP-binding cassette domain-containing protein n=1 Tax=Georgenia subflava TaxID=1622177 RepID=A0A6N7EPB6_9MICO|nr:ATP-binding cassette domain-containing protein [Georgenia subflava]
MKTVARDRSRATVALAVSGLTSGYAGAKVLHGVNLEVPTGGASCVVGRNGMGKSTLLKTIFGLVPRMAGEVELFGSALDAKTRPHSIARRGVAYIAQEQALFGDLTVEENISVALRESLSVEEGMARVTELFPKLGERRAQMAGTLSGGEQKMLLLARGLVNRPQLLILDEITEGLQPSVRHLLREVLADQREKYKTTVLAVEQDLEFAFSLADDFAVMSVGEIVKTGFTREHRWKDVALEFVSV